MTTRRGWRWAVLGTAAMAVWAGGGTAQEPVESLFSGMMTLTDATSARISSFDRTGGNNDFTPIAPGKTIQLAAIDGAGIIRHFYAGIFGGRHFLRDVVLRAYWDGEESPSVEVPFGDFFGLGHERARFYTSLMVTVNPGDLGVFGVWGFNSYFPMPFSKSARITLTNEGTDPVLAVWYHVEFDRMESVPEDLGRFHASWRRESPTTAVGAVVNKTLHNGTNTTGAENYVILEAQGRGNVAGLFLNVDNSMGSWYGEGDDMIFVDGEAWPPSYHGTGSEEIFGGGACPTDEYTGPYTGYHLIGNLDYTGKVSTYRFYVNDPIRFQKSIKMTIEHGHADNIANDYSSTVFWYQQEPSAPFPPLPPAVERRPRDGDDPHDRAWAALMGVRDKAMGLWMGSLRSGAHLPDDLAQLMKHDATQAYFNRDYPRVHELCVQLSARIDEYMKELAKPAAGN